MTVEVQEVGSGVFFVIGPITNWILIRRGEAITLVDAAWPRDFPAVEHSLDQIGAGTGSVEAVVLTHAHPDHVGVAERLRCDVGAVVHTHRKEAGHARGEYRQRVRTVDVVMRMWRPSVFVFGLRSIFHGSLEHVSLREVEIFDDSPLDVPGAPVPVATPGHTSGHCSFHMPDEGLVITGDALVNENILTGHSGPRLMPRIFNHDWEQAESSLDDLERLEAHRLLPGHGRVLDFTPAQAVSIARDRLAEGRWWDC